MAERLRDTIDRHIMGRGQYPSDEASFNRNSNILGALDAMRHSIGLLRMAQQAVQTHEDKDDLGEAIVSIKTLLGNPNMTDAEFTSNIQARYNQYLNISTRNLIGSMITNYQLPVIFTQLAGGRRTRRRLTHKRKHKRV
jgi:hypothetical protein